MTLPVVCPVVFPLFGIVDGKCACGATNCERIGKHPAVAWGDVEYGQAVPRPAPGAGAGLKCGAAPKGSGVFVVDLDGVDAAELFDSYGECPDTYTVATPRPSWHLYFAHPGFPVRNSAGRMGPGIDVRGDGGFVVAPGSPHRLGGTYAEADDSAQVVADAPEWLLEWLQQDTPVTEAHDAPTDVRGSQRDYHRALYAEYLRSEAPARGPARRGQGDATLFEVVQRGAYDLALPTADVLELVREHYDPRCSPMWGDELTERVMHKAKDAKQSSQRPRFEPMPLDVRLAVQATQPSAGMFEDLGLAPPTVDQGPSADRTDEERALGLTWGGWDADVPPPRYLVEPLVQVASVGMFVAKGSSIKTWTVLSLGASVAMGTPWLGRFPVLDGPVIVADYESGRYEIARRMAYLGAKSAARLGHMFPTKRLDDPEFWRLLGHVVKARGVRLVIIDSLAAGAPGIDENDARVALPLTYAGTFSEALDCAVIFLHHAKKGEGGDERDAARGSGALYAACDWMFTFTPLNDERTQMLIHCNKPQGPAPDDLRVELGVDGLALLQGEAVTPAAERDAALVQDIRAALAHGPLANKLAIDRALRKKSGTCGVIVDGMEARRELYRDDAGYHLDWPAARAGRIKDALRLPGMTTVGKLAAAAHVTEDELRDLLKNRRLYPSGTGFVYVESEIVETTNKPQ